GAGKVARANAPDRLQRSDLRGVVCPVRRRGDRGRAIRLARRAEGPDALCHAAGGAGMSKPNLLTEWFGRAQASARLMVGVPDYDTYVAHTRSVHPEKTVLSYEAFFQTRQEARYGRGMARCC